MNKRVVFIGIGLFILPLLVAGGFILIVRLQALFRYDRSYFTPAYQKLYSSPSVVASTIERAVRQGDRSIFTELTGLRHPGKPPDANPNARLIILLKITETDYFQYLFMDTKTYHRLMFNVKQVDGRWLMVPQDAFYYLDSGDWLLSYIPGVTIYWSLLAVMAVGWGIYSLAARFRRQLYAPAEEAGKRDKIDE